MCPGQWCNCGASMVENCNATGVLYGTVCAENPNPIIIEAIATRTSAGSRALTLSVAVLAIATASVM